MIRKFNFSEISILDWDKYLYDQLLNIAYSCNNEISQSFFKKIYDVLRNDKLITKINNNTYTLTSSENIDYIRKLATVKTLYIESISESSDLKFLIALVSTCFYNQEINFLSRDRLSNEFRNRLSDLLKRLNIQFGLSSNESYSENKLISNYSKAKNNNEYEHILKTMIQISNNPHVFYSSDCSWNLLISYIWYMDKNIIIDYLKTATFEMVELIYHALHEKVFEIMNLYDDKKNDYPIIRGLNVLFQKLDDDINSKRIQQISDVDCYSILCKMDDITIKQIQTYFSSLNIEYCRSYNYTIGHCCAFDTRFLDFFLNTSSMNIANAYAFSQGFIENNVDIDLFCESAEKVMKYYFDSINPSHINENVGFLEFFIKYYALTNSTKEQYLETLKEFNTKIDALQNSWDFKKMSNLWISFFYCVLSNRILNYQYNQDEIKQFLWTLYDKRNELFYDAYPIEFMKKMLLNPSSCNTVDLEEINNKTTVNLP